MINKFDAKPDRELEIETESSLIDDIDPLELEEVEAIDAPIWEGITAAIGSNSAAPDWNLVDDLGHAVGIEIPNDSILHTNEMLEHRDDDRWELDPQSAEDYES